MFLDDEWWDNRSDGTGVFDDIDAPADLHRLVRPGVLAPADTGGC